MKKLEKLKLHQLSKVELEERRMSIIRGGGTSGTCSCGCSNYNTNSNCSANDSSGYTTSSQNSDSAGCCTCGNGNTASTYAISNPT
jgi:natural product precursor